MQPHDKRQLVGSQSRAAQGGGPQSQVDTQSIVRETSAKVANSHLRAEPRTPFSRRQLLQLVVGPVILQHSCSARLAMRLMRRNRSRILTNVWSSEVSARTVGRKGLKRLG